MSIKLTGSGVNLNLTAGFSSKNINQKKIPPIVGGQLPGVELLLVGGGGGAGCRHAGGAGGGGMLAGPAVITALNSGVGYTITIGAGGAKSNQNGPMGTNGGNTSIAGLFTAAGGGIGGQFQDSFTNGLYGSPANNSSLDGYPGGSGGGTGGHNTSRTAGNGNGPGSTLGTGFPGGSGAGGPDWSGGGGGGAGGAGQNNPNNSNGGNGGLAAPNNITGSWVWYAGGGGGGGSGTGGLGGGTSISAQKGGATDGAGSGGSQGASNTGGGAGGTRDTGGNNGNNGGSGILIMAYPTAFSNLNVGGGLTYTLDFAGRPTYKVYSFTAGTGTITYPG
jgi:hypothetical protein